MCNEIYVPKDAFMVKDENARLENSRPSPATLERYNIYFCNLLHQGYPKDKAKKIADEKLEQYFEIYMARYYKKYNTITKV